MTSDRMNHDGPSGQTARLYRVPPASVTALLVAGVVLGVVGDALLRAPGPPGLNLSVWVASVAVAALALHRHAALALDRERVAWLVIGVVFAAGFAWRDAPPLKLLALGCATLSFALAAHRLAAAWVRRAGVLRYAGALALGALHAWTAAALALVDATRSTSRAETGRAAGWRRAAAVARGLVIATPLVVVFGALFMSADAVFAELVPNVLRIDFEQIASHILLFSILAWLATGYLRGFLTGTELPPLRLWRDGALLALTPKRPTLGITEVATALAALDLLFLVFVIVQFRYLFGGDALVQVTPDLTYAEYARRGFFELVFAVRTRRAGPARRRLAPRPSHPTRRLRVPRPRRHADRAGARDHRIGASAAAPLPRELRAHRVAVLRDGAADLDRRDAVVARRDRAARPP